DSDRELAEPEEGREQERPDEGRDAGIYRRGAEVHEVNRNSTGPKKFAEPVSLLSTISADLPLPGTAFGFGFDLLALRARRKQHTNAPAQRVKRSEKDAAAICGNFFFQHFHSPFSNMWTRLWRGA